MGQELNDHSSAGQFCSAWHQLNSLTWLLLAGVWGARKVQDVYTSMSGALVILHVAPLPGRVARASGLQGNLMVFGQHESQGPPRFKGKGNRFHLLMGEAKSLVAFLDLFQAKIWGDGECLHWFLFFL